MARRALGIGLATSVWLFVAPSARANEVPPPPAASAPSAAPAPLPVPAPTDRPSAPPAPADGAVPLRSAASDEADLARFRAFVDAGAAPSRSYRIAGGLVSLAIGGAAIPAGAVMLGRDESSIAGGIVLGAGIGAALDAAFILTGFGDDNPYLKIRDGMDASEARGASKGETFRFGEGQLQSAAAKAATARTVRAVLLLILGGSSAIAGTVFATADFTGDGVTRRDQDGIAAAFFSFGAVGTLAAVQHLLFPTPIESAWAGYSAAKRTSTAPRLRLVGGALPGGATVGLGGQF